MDIHSLLEILLWDVSDPGSYLGGEAGRIVKNSVTPLTDIVLLFPDVYELGMSHGGEVKKWEVDFA